LFDGRRSRRNICAARLDPQFVQHVQFVGRLLCRNAASRASGGGGTSDYK
jgi:hypothetical protein